MVTKEQIIDDSHKVAIEALKNFFRNLGFNEEAFNHLYNIPTFFVDFLKKEKAVLKIQLCTFVIISEDTVLALEKDGKIVFPANFLAQCASFGHGALRGIMYLKTINTPLEGIILPPVVYGDVFKKSIAFDRIKE